MTTRPRGRPAVGPIQSIRLSPGHLAIAYRLGSTNVSKGVRAALDIANRVYPPIIESKP